MVCFVNAVMHLKDEDGLAGKDEPDPVIWVCTVSSDQSVPIF